MKLLTDREILRALSEPNPIVQGIDLSRSYTDVNCQVRAAAVELRVGEIFLPSTDANAEGSVSRPKMQHTLHTGETAIFTTLETFDFPDDVAAVAFPSSSVSIHALLMTNPGYIDPGYSGKLRFTVINMGTTQYHLEHGAKIVTMLLFRLDQAVEKGWAARRPGVRYLAPKQEDLGKLSKDFLSVEERSTKFAHDEVEGGLLKLKAAEASFAAAEKKWTFRLGLVSVLVLILPVLISYVTSIRSLQDDQSALDAKFKVIEAKLDSGEVKRRVDEQDTRIKDHDARLKSLEKK